MQVVPDIILVTISFVERLSFSEGQDEMSAGNIAHSGRSVLSVPTSIHADGVVCL